MRQLALALWILFLVACGAEPESAGPGAAGDPAARLTQDAQQLIESATAAVGQAAADEARRCLQLLADEKHLEAVPVCRRAHGMDPRNQEVAAALDAASAKSRDAAHERCIDLLQRELYKDAVSTCNTALGMAPEDPELKTALEVARRGAAQQAKEAREAAEQAATEAAAELAP